MTTNWQIDDRTLELTIADQYIYFIQQAMETNSPFICDTVLRVTIQFTCQLPADPEQMNRLRRLLNDRLLRKIERDHRPKAAAAIEYFKQFYQDWVNSGASEEAIEQVTIDAESIDDFMEIVEDDES